MSVKAFFDTSVLLYAFAHDPQKTPITETLLGHGGYINVQVLNEFTSVSRRKLDMSWAEVATALSAIRDLCQPPAPLTLETHEEALRIARRFNYNIYDSLILAAAKQADCNRLYSEDMQHGQRIGTLLIHNPFRP
jgi:predicted nucleic acid-binding protein